MPQRRMLCIGAVNIDRVYSVVQAVRDGESIVCHKHFASWGGKGLNQMISLRRAGVAPMLFAKVGSKDYASLVTFLEENQMDTSGILSVDGETNYGIIQVNEVGQTAIVGVPSADINFSHDEMEDILSCFLVRDVLLVQNEMADVPALLRGAKARGLTVVLNPSPLCHKMWEWPLDCVDILILNKAEGEALSGETEPEVILQRLAQNNPKGSVLLTLGECGCLYWCDGNVLHQQATPANAVDTTAAGDTFTGFFLASYLRDGNAQTALATASKASSIVVGRMGAAATIPSWNEVEALNP